MINPHAYTNSSININFIKRPAVFLEPTLEKNRFLNCVLVTYFNFDRCIGLLWKWLKDRVTSKCLNGIQLKNHWQLCWGGTGIFSIYELLDLCLWMVCWQLSKTNTYLNKYSIIYEVCLFDKQYLKNVGLTNILIRASTL